MKIFKNSLCIIIFILTASSSFGQTLKVIDLRKSFNYHKPNEHKQLLSKGFKLLSDTTLINQKQFKYNKPDTKEIIELTFKENGEGDEYLSIIYLSPSELNYKKFIATINTYKFKYSKKNKRYQLTTSSYSGENIYLNGLTQYDGKKYYSLKYVNYVEKALSGPRPKKELNTHWNNKAE